MWYRMPLNTDDGRVYSFVGFRLIHDQPIYDVWHDTTTLYITVYDGPSNTSAVLGKGVLLNQPQDFFRQLTTLRATNTASIEQRLEAEGRFAGFFLGALAQKYGKVFRPPLLA